MARPEARLGLEVTTLAYVAAFAILWQAAVAWLLVRERPVGESNGIMAILFALNAAVNVPVLASSIGLPFDRALAWTTPFDAPTGALLALLAVAVVTERKAAWRPWVRNAALAIGVVYLARAALAATGFLPNEATRVALEVTPLFVSYPMITAAFAFRFLRADSVAGEWREGLLLVAFGSRAAEFGVFYGAMGLLRPARDASTLVGILGGLATLAVVLGVVAAVARAPGSRHWVMVALALVAAAAFGLFSHSGAEPVGIYLLSLVTLYFVRPTFVAAALFPGVGMRWLGGVSLGIAAYASAKLVIAALMGRPFFAGSLADPLAFALVVVSAPLALQATRTRSRKPAPAPARAAPTRAWRLVFHLLGSPGSTQRDIEEATGISGRHLAEVVVEAERLLTQVGGHDAEPPFVEVEAANVKGRKRYRLTRSGELAARALESPPAPGETIERGV